MAELSPLDFADIAPDLQTTLKPIVDRLGYFGAFFQYGAHAPTVLNGFMALSGALKRALADDINETLALSICTAMDFPYERIQHERLSLKLGFDREWVALMVGRPSMAAATPLQQAARDLALALVDGRDGDARAAAATITQLHSPAIAIASLFQATRFIQVCQIGRTLDMQLALPSIFATNDS